MRRIDATPQLRRKIIVDFIELWVLTQKDAHLVFDRFGREQTLFPTADGGFTVTVEVVPSPQFFAWLTGLGRSVRILGPQPVRQAFLDHLQHVLSAYESGRQSPQHDV